MTQLNLGISLRVDESYIAEENQRLRIYKKIAGAQSEAVIADVRAELEDRYGELPELLHLLEAANLRLECERIGVRRSIASEINCIFASPRMPMSIPAV